MPKFNSKNFAVWRFQIESYLAVHNLVKIVDRTSKRPSKASRQSKWDKLDRKAQLVIRSALETSCVKSWTSRWRTRCGLDFRRCTSYKTGQDDHLPATTTILRLPNGERWRLIKVINQRSKWQKNSKTLITNKTKSQSPRKHYTVNRLIVIVTSSQPGTQYRQISTQW